MQDEHQNNWVELKDGALGENTEGNILVSPALGNPIGHNGRDGQSRRNGCALKVLGLAALVLWQYSNRDVKPSQTGQAAEHKEGEEKVVKRCPNSERECGSGGSEAK